MPSPLLTLLSLSLPHTQSHKPQTSNQESDREFHLVFRTFGIDTAEVAQEFNCFCNGTHPLFTPSRPERTHERRLELPRDSGVIHRTGAATAGEQLLEGGVHLAMVSGATQVMMNGFVCCAGWVCVHVNLFLSVSYTYGILTTQQPTHTARHPRPRAARRLQADYGPPDGGRRGLEAEPCFAR